MEKLGYVQHIERVIVYSYLHLQVVGIISGSTHDDGQLVRADAIGVVAQIDI